MADKRVYADMQQPAAAMPLPGRDPAAVVLTVLMWVAWFGVIVVADFMGFLMFAFADAPGSAGAAQLMIVPTFVWFGFTFVAGIILLILKRRWQIVLAFVLAISPPFLVFAGYNLLDGAGRAANNLTPAIPRTPVNRARRVSVPEGGFRPNVTMPTQPDFRSAFTQPTTRRAPTTQP